MKSECIQVTILLLIIALAEKYLHVYAPTLIMSITVLIGYVFLLKPISIKFIKFLFLPILILLLVSASTQLSAQPYDIIRDVLFFLMPVVGLVFGYYIASKLDSIRQIFKIYYILSTFFIALFFFDFIFHSGTNDNFESYLQSPIIFPAYILLICDLKFSFSGVSKFRLLSLLIFTIITALLTLSRTTMLLYIIAPIFVLGTFSLNIISFLRVALIFAIFSAPVYFVISSNEVLKNKTENSFSEIAISDHDSYEDVTYNWRGYEAFRALTAYINDGGIKEKIFGYGAGKRISLGMKVKLGDGYYYDVPIIHNGYFYILIKSGMLGLVLYFVFLLTIFFRHYESKMSKKTHLAFVVDNIIATIAVTLSLQTFVVGGWTSVESQIGVILLLGILLYFKIKKVNLFKC